MNKVFEVHLGYLLASIVLVVHAIIGFYLLYILQIDLGKLELPSAQKIVWYSPPPVQPEPPAEPTTYVPPPVTAEVPTAQRSSAQRRASWTKARPEQQVQHEEFSAARIVQEISEQQAQQRSAQAVYTKEDAIKARVAAQMIELSQEQSRNKVLDALTMVCLQTSTEYYTPRAIASSILFALVLSQEGEIISVEILRSTGKKSLDDHITMLLQKIKKIAIPPRKIFTGVYTMTFEFGVNCKAGSNHLEVIRYDGKAATHII